MKKDKIAKSVLRNQIYHYKEKGIGEQSDLSNNTTITPELIKMTLERYIELGGSLLDFVSESSDCEEYKSFMKEIEAC